MFNIVGTLQDGAFQVKSVVAEGGFAVVYRAYHQSFRADVALKCLKVPGALTASKQEEFLEKFRAEGELLFRLSAAIPAVVRPLHIGTLQTDQAEFVPFIALEWLDGETLDQFIERRRQAGKPPLDMRRAVQLLAPAARALEQAHKFAGPTGTVSILHRDLKPENLFVASLHGREAIKILDFGIGKVKTAATQIVGHVSMEQSSFSAFTPAYGAPEQWLPKRFGQTGTWTDVWGFALTMVELVTGKTPLDGDAHAVMGAAMDETQRPTPRTLGLATSDAVEAAFQKALAVDPRNRYADIGDFWDALEAEFGMATTRVWATPNLDSAPPPDAPDTGAGSKVLRNAVTEVASGAGHSSASGDIPDLLPGPAVSKPVASKPVGQNKPRVAAGLDPFDDLGELGMGGDVVPMAGGFRLDTAEDSPGLHRPPQPVAARPPSAAVARFEAAQASRSSASFMSRLAGPAKILSVAIVIMVLDWIYTMTQGQALQVGPATAIWLAGPIAVLAILKLVFVLISDS